MAPKGGIRKRMAEAAAEEATAPTTSSSAPRGGIRQRAVREAQLDEQPPQHRPFSESLKRDWAIGKLSSPQVQEYAKGQLNKERRA